MARLYTMAWETLVTVSRLAQLVERKTFNLVVVGSSPTVGVKHFFSFFLVAPGPLSVAKIF